MSVSRLTGRLGRDDNSNEVVSGHDRPLHPRDLSMVRARVARGVDPTNLLNEIFAINGAKSGEL